MKIKVFWVGKTKERFIREGVEKYLGLLRPLASVQVVELKEERGKPREAALAKEAQRILKQAGETFTLLDERGKGLGSMQFAKKIKGKSSMEFVIGGPYGVSDVVREQADDMMSLSAMTLTHEMARLLLLEQLYRAVTINAGRGYHH